MENLQKMADSKPNGNTNCLFDNSKMVKKSNINLKAETAFFVAALKENEDWEQMRKLMQPKPNVSLRWILIDVGLIAMSMPIGFNPLSFFFTARALRSLNNQGHDLAHNNVFSKTKWNKHFSKWILMPFMFLDYDRYTSNHHLHHGLLGKDSDPDIIVDRPKIYVKDSSIKAITKVLYPSVFNLDNWKNSLLGDLVKKELSIKNKRFIGCWWAVLLVFLFFIKGWGFVLDFLVLILITRGTLYHMISRLAELADHAFLSNSSVVAYTRTMPSGFASWFWYPDNDNYHIAHHLFPKVSMPNLPKAHRLLMKIEAYRKGQHLDTYFFGKKSLLRALIGRFDK